MSGHVISTKLYVTIWIALMCLTVITAAVAFVDLGPLNTVVALCIATFKALLVVLIFMHVKYTSEKLTKTVVISAIFFLFLLLGLSMADYTTRLLG
ncbi:MAG TPA: cytochrome C oxidase subunit IV family protein [Terriglobales bacterium]|nr:cytochrome C oxidase subunit IV family protein [Terriglobales bacterium]